MAEVNIPERLIALLAEEPDPKSSTIRLQDFVKDGRAYIPIFSSQVMYEKSSGGAKLPYPKYELARPLLLGMFSGVETVIVDVNTEKERVYSAKDLKEQYRTEIAEFNAKMRK